jgi:hypothetical protein
VDERVDGAFAFTFVMPKYPYHPDPRFDLDMASYGLVKSYADRAGTIYRGVPWDPKQSFRALADYYARAGRPRDLVLATVERQNR